MSEPTGGRKDIARDATVNELRAKLYERLMEAEQLIARKLYQRGVSHDTVLAALDAIDEQMSEEQRREDLYLSALGRYVEALGGRLEVRAVFGDEEILVRGDPTA